MSSLVPSPLHISAPIPIPPPKLTLPRPSKPGPAFICTICWQPQHAPSRPKLLGTSARIVCRACWKAVLDLSICWVCGECIVRGDEVVSLGWCFWHWGCFGCLVCGERMTVPENDDVVDNGGEGKKREQNRSWGSWDTGTDAKRRRCLGVELSEIPVCRVCTIETAGESRGEVLERGLETVDRFDGGLSRDRLGMLGDEGKTDLKVGKRRKLQPVRRSRGSRSQKTTKSGDRDSGDSQLPLVHNAADMGTSEDGTHDEPSCCSDTELSDFGPLEPERRPEIYVSIFDPVGEPAFKPSKTKPLPKWMQLLPNNVHRERDEKRRKAYQCEVDSHSHELQVLGKCPWPRIDQDSSIPFSNHLEGSSETSPKGPRTPSPSLPIDILVQPNKRATIAFDPRAKKHYKSEGSGIYRRTTTTESTYMTPPEYPFPTMTVPPRQRTPFPRLSRPNLERNPTSSYFSHSIDTSEAPLETSPPISPDDDTPIAKVTPESLICPERQTPHSSEYIEKYSPVTREDNTEKYIATAPEPVLDKIRRQRLAEAAEEQEDIDTEVSETTSGNGNGRGSGLDPRMINLHKELKSLFGG